MEEEKKIFWKLLCSRGHESMPIEDKTKVRNCMNPDCGKPIDRRYDRWVSCDAEGNLLGNIDEITRDDKEEDISEIDRTNIEKKQSLNEEGTQLSSKENSQAKAEGNLQIRWGRKWETSLNQNFSREKIQECDEQNNDAPTQIVLFSDGKRISVPNEGGYLGRTNLGSEAFQFNRLVSRKHAFVRPCVEGGINVKDADSLNGTYIEDEDGRIRLMPGEMVRLQCGNKIWLGNHLVVIGDQL